MRVLLVGGAGLLGSYLAPALEQAGHDVALCDDFSGSLKYRTSSAFRIFTTNFTDLNAVQHPVKAFNPEIIILAVAHYFSRDVIYKFYEDTKLTLGCANSLCSILGPEVKHVYFCSGHEVYGGPQTHKPLKESRKILRSATHHGTAERAAESILEYHCNTLGIPFTALRIFDMYGPRVMFSPRTGVVSFLMDSFLKQDPVGLVSPLDRRDFIHAEDVKDAFLAVIKSGFSGTVNIGTGKPTTLRGLVGAMIKCIGANHEIYEVKKGGTFSSVADVELLNSLVKGGWKPRHSILGDLEDLAEFRKEEVTSSLRTDPALVLNAMRGISNV